MRRTMHALSFTSQTSDTLDELVRWYERAGIPAELEPYLRAPDHASKGDVLTPALIDQHDLKLEDYAALYAELPRPLDMTTLDGRLLFKAREPVTTPNWEVLNAQIRKREPNPKRRDVIFKRIKKLQGVNRRELKHFNTVLSREVKPLRGPVLNRSRIVEALILFSRDTLRTKDEGPRTKERVSAK